MLSYAIGFASNSYIPTPVLEISGPLRPDFPGFSPLGSVDNYAAPKMYLHSLAARGQTKSVQMHV